MNAAGKILLTVVFFLVGLGAANAAVMPYNIQPGLAGDFNYFNTDFNIVFLVVDDNAAASAVYYYANIYYSPTKGEQTTTIATDVNLGTDNTGTGYCTGAIGTTAVGCSYPFPSISGVADGNYFIDVNIAAYFDYDTALDHNILYDQNMDSNVSFSVDTTSGSITISSGKTSTSRSYTLQYSASDANSSIVKYWVKADGGNWIDNSTNTSYSFNIGLTEDRPALHIYYVKGTDHSDNNTAAFQVTVKFESDSGGGESCGNGACRGNETAANCPSDCEAECGDGACTHSESVESCEEDCLVVCGDGICSTGSGEDCETCEEDCGTCQGEQTVFSRTFRNKPTGEEIAAILAEAGASQNAIQRASQAVAKTSVSRQIEVVRIGKRYETRVTLRVQNQSGKTLRNVKLMDKIPKSIVSELGEEGIESLAGVEIVKADPIIRLTIPSIGEGQTGSVSYTLLAESSETDAEAWDAPVVEDATEEQQAQCGSDSECDDGNPCTVDRCIGGSCSAVAAADGTGCGFGLECRAGACVSVGQANSQAGGIDLLAIATIVIVLAVVIFAAYSYYGKRGQ